MKDHPAAGSISLHLRLRSATAGPHRDLEDALALLHPPLDRERFIRALAGFHGFHQVWERAIEASSLPRAFVPTSRLRLIEQDLRALGVTESVIAAIAPCPAAAVLGADADAALGSVYVLEGSTLGGRVILRHLGEAHWCPADGLRYFDPYGDLTAARWRETLARLELAGGDPEQIIVGAVRTFRILRDWLAPRA